MPDVREAFEAVTAPPEPGARERQHRRQRRAVRKRQVGALAITAAIVLGIAVVALDRSHSDDGPPTFVDKPTVDAPPSHEDDTYLLTVGDGKLTLLPSPIDGWSYRFSPNGSTVAFTALDAAGDQQVYRMRADGTGRSELTDPGFSSEWAVNGDEPAWSPNGDWLVISGTDSHNGRRSLYFLFPREISQTGSHAPPRSGFGWSVIRQASEPTWSPDSQEIAFTETADDGPKILLVRASRYGRQSITAGRPKTLLDGASSFSWSPDGTRVVFVASDAGRVSVADPDGTNIRAIADGSSANPSWSPDGAAIAYDDLTSGRIAIYDVASGATRYLHVGACTQGWVDAATLLVTTECER